MAYPGSKPLFIDPAGDARNGSLPVRPPFRFSGVTARVFPLKANMARLTRFCDQYVNMDIPPEIVHYRPALPYVYLMVLDYGSLSSASTNAQNVGWVAQHEVAFTVPLQRWRREKGQWMFKDWACVSPFIFVDDEMSLTTGREVYGWPKVAGHVDATVPMWQTDPTAHARLFTFSTSVFPKVYAGESESPRVLLQINASPQPALAEFPLDPAKLWLGLTALSQATRSSLSLMGNALDMLLALPVRGYQTHRNPKSLRAMGAKAVDYLTTMGPAFLAARRGGSARPGTAAAGHPPHVLAFDNVTLKQFRDAQDPSKACYKALICSTMGIDRINRSGLLGEPGLLRGDPSGGYSIRVHRYASQPIIESLGLEVERTESVAGSVEVSVLKPTFPFWNDVELNYGAGSVICSRMQVPCEPEGSDAWQDEQADAATPSAPATTYHAADAPAGTRSDYNTALGAATQPVAGPFDFPDVTLQVYPLLAERAQLERFVQQYLNEPLQDAGMRFETMGAYAYLAVQVTGDQHGTMWSSANNIGWWAEREVSFCLPLKWYRKNAQGAEELVSLAMVAPFVYASNGRAVISDREVNGRPSVKAHITSPKDVWLDNSGPARDREYLRLQTEVFPALGYGQGAEQRTLLEIDGRDVLAWNDTVGWRLVAERWGRHLVEDLQRKTAVHGERADDVRNAQALALEVLALGAPVNWLVLKQYRDAAEVERACYQALVCTRRSIGRIYDIREIDNRVHVRLYRTPGHPIADALGLKVKSLDSRGGNVVQNLQPLRPFWMRLSLREELATVIAVRKLDGGWQLADAGLPPETATQPYFCATAPTRVSAYWPMQPQRLHAQAAEALDESLRHEARAAGDAADAAPADPMPRRLGRAEARASIAAISEVQVVLEAILSAEWENWGNPRWYQQLPSMPDHFIPGHSLGGEQLRALDPDATDPLQALGLSYVKDGACWVVTPVADPAQQ